MRTLKHMIKRIYKRLNYLDEVIIKYPQLDLSYEKFELSEYFNDLIFILNDSQNPNMPEYKVFIKLNNYSL